MELIRGMREGQVGDVLAVWSTHPDKPFTRRLGMSGFKVEEIQVPATGTKGTRHTLWFATKQQPKTFGPAHPRSPRDRSRR